MTTPAHDAVVTSSADAVSPVERAADLGGVRDLLEPSSAALDALRARLAAHAVSTGLTDAVYAVLPTPIGALTAVRTDAGLLAVGFEDGHDALLDRVGERIGLRLVRSAPRLATVARCLEEYFTGARTEFDIPLDLRLTGGFRQVAQTALARIPYGHTVSYTELASMVGRPTAVRAAGSACATNPLAIVLPCHRVVRTDGGLGGYAGGLPVKRALLALESRHRPPGSEDDGTTQGLW